MTASTNAQASTEAQNCCSAAESAGSQWVMSPHLKAIAPRAANAFINATVLLPSKPYSTALRSAVFPFIMLTTAHAGNTQAAAHQ
jgi:hypothetical protein